MKDKSAASPASRLLHGETTDRILGVFYQVHYELGFGYAESVYGAAMRRALADAELKVEREVPIEVHFRGSRIATFRADLIVEGCVILEIKARQHLDAAWEAQLLNYLRATELEVGLLLQFSIKPSFKRLVYTNDRKLLRA